MIDQRTTIGTGFQVEDPLVFLPWGSPLSDVRDKLSTHLKLFKHEVVQTECCTVLGGLRCSMLLHGTREEGEVAMRERLTMISFWKQGEFRAIFDQLQVHLVQTFGAPQEVIRKKGEDPGQYLWILGDVVVGHYASGESQQRASIRKAY
jgi:hypothetical protein